MSENRSWFKDAAGAKVLAEMQGRLAAGIVPPSRSPYKPEADPDVRRSMLGATDGAAILGISPHKTAVDVYAEKVGLRDPEDLDGNEAVSWGIRLEDDVADAYAARTGALMEKYPGTARLKEKPYIGCHPDYVAMHDDSRMGSDTWLVEVKTAGIASPMAIGKRLEWGLEGSDQIPHHYLVQCHHQMLCTGADRVDLAALIAGRGLVIHTVRRDNEFLDWYEAQLTEFWMHHVIIQSPPVPQTLDDIRIIYPRDAGLSVEADEYIAAEIDRLRSLKSRIKTMQAEADAAELAIKTAMADAAALTVGGQIVATWKSSDQSRIDTKALRAKFADIAAQVTTTTPVRRFLLKEGK